ncbi:MAG: glycine--tRNA ligase subunit beta [Bryobacterales bacterium]|nr:glycine--tRNA ligase subunit beta [Bryobacterales bacterium]
MSVPFLLEIGTEEIPDWMIPGALEQLRTKFTDLMAKLNLAADDVRVDATPRRLVLRASGLPPRQQDAEELLMGPPKAAPAAAVAGFARKLGVAPEELVIETTAKGEYYSFRRKVAGQATSDLLAAALPDLILSIHFPKTMYWAGKNGPRFIRPIRWLVALLGDSVVPFEIAGVASGAVTRGHRRLGQQQVAVTIAGYEQTLRDNYVLLSAGERRRKIEDEIRPLGARPDAALLETLVFITEYPAAISGQFDPAFLSLPEEVLTTVMRFHQKYFSVDGGGQLAARFVAVMNTSADPDGLVRQGNERVLRARFNDARFFWDTDQKRPLRERVADLAHVTFQAKLGSYLEKTERVVNLVTELGGGDAARRAALLAKCDLTTELVKEFTELQGVVGGLYARAQGEPEEVALAIYDHYKPLSMEDSLPRTRDGQLVSLADKLDTLRGCFGIGLVPTGSRDPFALRRAAQGVVRILAEGGWETPLRPLLLGDTALEEFFLDRIRYYFREVRGFRYDEVNAVLAAGWDNLPDALRRIEALAAVRPTPNFEPLAASFKRIQNILRQAEFAGPAEVRTGALEPGPETELHAEFERVRQQAASLPYLQALEAIASLRPKVDLFFDKVLVNAPDPDVRRNRLALLSAIRTEFSTIADFSEIATNQ